MAGTVRGTFDLSVPARRKLRELRNEGTQTDAVMGRLGRTLDTLAGQRAHRALDSYQRNLSGLKTDLGESRAAAQGLDSNLGKLGRKTVRPRVQLRGVTEARRDVAALNRDLDKLDRRTVGAGVGGFGGGGGGGGGGAFGGIGPGGPFVGGRLGRGALAAGALGPALATGAGSMVGGLGGGIGALGPLALGAGAVGGSMFGAAGLMQVGMGAVGKTLKPALAAHKAYAEQVRKTGEDSKEARKKHKAMEKALKQLSPQARATAKSMIGLSRDFERSFTTGDRANRIFRTMNVGVTMLSRRGLPMLTKAFDAMQPVVESNLRRLDRYLGSIRGASELSYATRFAPSVADRGFRTAGQAGRLGGQLMGGVGMPVAERLLARAEPFLKNRADYLTTPAGRARMGAVENRGVETSRAAGRTGWALVQSLERLLVGPAGANTVRMLDAISTGFFPALTNWLNETSRYGPRTIDTLSTLTRTLGILFAPGGAADIGSMMINNLAHALEGLAVILGPTGMAVASLGAAVGGRRARANRRGGGAALPASGGPAAPMTTGQRQRGGPSRIGGAFSGMGAGVGGLLGASMTGSVWGVVGGVIAGSLAESIMGGVSRRLRSRFGPRVNRAIRGVRLRGAILRSAGAEMAGGLIGSMVGGIRRRGGRARAALRRLFTRRTATAAGAEAAGGLIGSLVGGIRTKGGRARAAFRRLFARRVAVEAGAAGAAGLIGSLVGGIRRRGGRARSAYRRLFARRVAAEAGAAGAAGLIGSLVGGIRRRRGRVRGSMRSMLRSSAVVSAISAGVMGAASWVGSLVGGRGLRGGRSRGRVRSAMRSVMRRAGLMAGVSAASATAGSFAGQIGGGALTRGGRRGRLASGARMLGRFLGPVAAGMMIAYMGPQIVRWLNGPVNNWIERSIQPHMRRLDSFARKLSPGRERGPNALQKVTRRRHGGAVGTGRYGGGDRVPIMGEPGEFMVRKEVVRGVGINAMQRFNATGVMGMREGGRVAAIRRRVAPAPRRLSGRRNPGSVMADDVVRGLRRVSRPGARAVVNATASWGRAMVRQSRRSGPQAAANRIERGTVRELTPLRTRGGRQVARATQAWGTTMRRGGQRIVRNVRGTTNDVTAQWRRGGARTRRIVRAATNDITAQWRRGGQRTTRTVRASTSDVDRQFRRLRRSSEGQTRAAARGVGRNMFRMRRATRVDMSGIESHSSRAFTRLRNGVSRSSERIRRNVTRSVDRTRRGVGNDFEGMRHTGEQKVERLRRGVERDFDAMGRGMVRKMSLARRDVDRNFAMIRSSATKQLKSSGLGAGEIRKVMSGRKLAKGGRIRAAGGVRIPGQGTADTVPIASGTIAAPGELVINRHTEAKHDKDARRHGLPTLSQRVEGEGAPHSAPVSPGLLQGLGTRQRRQGLMGLGALSGGYAGKKFPDGGKSVAIPGNPGEFINSRVLGSAMGLIKRFNLKVTDAFATAGHKGAGHLVHGTAMDVVPGGGSWDQVDKAVAFARARNMKVLYNGVPNHGRGHHAHIELKPGIGGGGMASELKLKALKTKLAGFPGGIAQQTIDNVTRGVQSGWSELAGAGMGGGGASGKGSWNVAMLTKLAKSVGMPKARQMAAIAMAESGGNPGVTGGGTGSDDGRGLWQIEWPVWRKQFAGMNPLNPRQNAEMAKHILGAQGLGAWTVYRTGAYRRYMAKGGRVADGGWNRKGGSFDTSGPTVFGAGEGGSERVTITPNQRRRPAVGGSARGGGGGTVIDVGGVHIAGYGSTADVLRDADKIGRKVADKIKEAMQGDSVRAADLL